MLLLNVKVIFSPANYMFHLQDDVEEDNFGDCFKDLIHWDTDEGQIRREYHRALKGFSSRLSKESLQKVMFG